MIIVRMRYKYDRQALTWVGDVGVLQQRYVARHVAGDADVSDLLQGTSRLPYRHRDQLRHIAVVVGSHGDGKPPQNHVWFHLQSGNRMQAGKRQNCHDQITETSILATESHFYLIQCDWALPSDCQKDVVSRFVILKMSEELDETCIVL